MSSYIILFLKFGYFWYREYSLRLFIPTIVLRLPVTSVANDLIFVRFSKLSMTKMMIQ